MLRLIILRESLSLALTTVGLAALAAAYVLDTLTPGGLYALLP